MSALQHLANWDQASRLVSELLDASRLQLGQLGLHPAPADLPALVRAVVDEQRRLALSRQLGRHVPARWETPVRADADHLHEVEGLDEDSFLYRQRNTGGLNRKRYQQRIDNRRMDFAREMAEALEALVAHEGATRVILAGDAVVIPILHQALSPQLEPLVSEQILRLDIRSPRADVQAEIAPLLAQIEADESHDVATRLIEAVREQGLGVTGEQETRDALTHGQAETLVLAEEAPLAAPARNELVHLAAVSGATVETVKGHEALEVAGGVGALLRYQLAWV